MNKPKKVLIVALDNLGDTIMASALFKPVRDAWPGVQVGFFGKDYASGLFTGSFDNIKFHLADPFWDKTPVKNRGSLGTFLKIFIEIRKEKYDLALILNTEWRRSAVCFLAGIPHRFGFARRKSWIFLNHIVPLPDQKQHVLEDHLALFNFVTEKELHAGDIVPQLIIDPPRRKQGENWRQGLKWESRHIALLHLTTGDSRRIWPLSNWLEMVGMLSIRNPNLRFSILCTEREKTSIAPQFKKFSEGLVQFVGGDLASLKSYFSQASIFVGGDSGPGHMAAAFGIPVVSLFGPTTDPERYRPMGAKSVRILRHNPIQDLPINRVIEAVEGCLQEKKEAAHR